VALDAGDRDRLRRIEAKLAEADPALVGLFQRWRPASGPRPIWPGWSVLPGWMLMVFVVGFVTWVAGPALGGAVAAISCSWAGLRRTRHLRVRDDADLHGGGSRDDGRGGRRSDRSR
jgi:hypothetical protein